MIKVVKQGHDIWGECPSTMIESLKWIESAGRVCYQSQGKVTEDSYLKFVQMLADRGHWAMLEHSNLVLRSSCRQHMLDASNFIKCRKEDGDYIYAGNLRAYMESLEEPNPMRVYAVLERNLLPAERQPLWARSVTTKFTTNRAMLCELTRHRVCSFAVLSQRYVDHRKTMEFIFPQRFQGRENSMQYDLWYKSMEQAADNYICLREYGESPQEARDVLPNSKSTEIVITADLQEWKHIFGLRCAPDADPMMQDLMIPVRRDFVLNGWVE